MQQETRRYAVSPHVTPLVLSVCGLLYGVYLTLRFGGWWGEADTSAAARAIQAMYETGKLVPGSNQPVYPNGYSYQALSTFVLNLTGLRLDQYKLFLMPLLMAWLVAPAWMLYRELTGSHRGAALGTIFLLVQPEFIFVVLRGTHEKFTRGLMLLCLFLFIRSLRSAHSPSRFAALVVCFYLTAHAIVSNNNLLGSSFIAGLGLSLALTWLVLRRVPRVAEVARPTVRRLAYTLAVSIALLYLSIFYLYPPSQHGLHVVHSIWDRVAVLLLSVAPEEDAESDVYTNPYEIVNNGWISLPVYFALSFANWLALGLSSLIWIVRSVRWLLLGQPPADRRALLLWAFFGAFAVQGALSILVDVSGALSSNLQHRIFPSFVMLAVPLTTDWVARWRPPSVAWSRLFHGVGGVFCALLAAFALWKATNEPLLSNKWPFMVSAELRALSWAEERLPLRWLWLGFDEQFPAAVLTRTGKGIVKVRVDMAGVNGATRDLMVSDVTRARSQRIGRALPIEADSLITYDNGAAQIYHLRPRTVYQR